MFERRAATDLRRWLTAGALCGTLAAGLARPAAGQRLDWSGFVDSLATRVDTAGLRALVPANRKRADADALVAGGFAALRLHELTRRDRDVNTARDLFGQATEHYPTLAWAHYGRALSLAGSPGLTLPSPGGVLKPIVTEQALAEVVHADRASRARRSLRRALQLDSVFPRAAVELARQAIAGRDQEGLAVAHTALVRIRAAGRADAATVLMLAETERALGSVESAAATAAAPDAGSSAASDYARAAALLRDTARQADGAKAYFAGVERLDSLTAERYFDDIRWIAAPDELSRWRSANLQERQQFLRDFWSMRSAVAGIEVAERLGSHYRRLATVQERYPREARRGVASTEAHTLEPSGTLPPFDDRGIIYLRHGEPDRVLSTSDEELQPNESWVYQGSDGRPRSFHFVKLRDAAGYRLVDDLMAVWSPTTDNFSAAPIIRYLDERVPYDDAIAPLLARMRALQAQASAGKSTATSQGLNPEEGAWAAAMNGSGELVHPSADLKARLRERSDVALRTDTDEPRFAGKVPFYYDLYTFRGPTGKTDLVATLAVPADRLTPAGEQNAYLLRLSLIVVDTVKRLVSRVDTTYALRTERPLALGDYIRVEAQLPAPPSNTAVERLVLRDQAGGAGEAYSSSVPLRPYSGEFSISDIVLAEPGSPGTWRRGSVSLALVPPREFPEGSFSVFYEIYNLPGNAGFETSIRVEGMDRSAISALLGRAGGAIRMTFRGDAPADPSVVQELRRIRGDLKPGRYRITIQVKDLATGKTASRDREFVVAKKKK